VSLLHVIVGDWWFVRRGDGTTGAVYLGEVPLKQPEVSGGFAQILAWFNHVVPRL